MVRDQASLAAASSKRGVERVKAIARTELDGDKALLQNPFFKRKVAELEVDLTALEFTELRTLAGEAAGKGPGPESSLLKIKGSEIQQAITALASQVSGPYAAAHILPDDQIHELSAAFPQDQEHMTAQYYNYRKTTIYGGSNEVQKSIICRMILGL